MKKTNHLRMEENHPPKSAKGADIRSFLGVPRNSRQFPGIQVEKSLLCNLAGFGGGPGRRGRSGWEGLCSSSGSLKSQGPAILNVAYVGSKLKTVLIRLCRLRAGTLAASLPFVQKGNADREKPKGPSRTKNTTGVVNYHAAVFLATPPIFTML